jgi:hypothetical protein
MAAPKLFFGLRDEASLFEADVDDEDDDGVDFESGGKTNRLAPAGPRGECLFCFFGLTFSWTGGPYDVTVLPTVDEVVGDAAPAADGVTLLGQVITLPDAGDERVTDTFEIPILEVYRRGNIERLRNHPRGRWIQADIRWGSIRTVIVDNLDVEYEIVRETQQAQE